MDTGLSSGNKGSDARRGAGKPGGSATSSAADTATEARLHRLTRDAFALLNNDPRDAHYAQIDGMLLVEGALVAVTPTSIGSYHGGPRQPGLLISAEAGYRFTQSSAARTAELLGQASTLLATFGAAIGCNAQGWMMLHRALAAQHLTGVTLAAEIVATRRLQRLLDEPPLGSDIDQAGVRAGDASTG